MTEYSCGLKEKIKQKINELESWDSVGIKEIMRETEVNLLRELLK